LDFYTKGKKWLEDIRQKEIEKNVWTAERGETGEGAETSQPVAA
jgi:hypothetical protein